MTEDRGRKIPPEIQEALRDSADSFQALVNNSPDVIARFDRQGRHVYVNPAISHYVDLAPEDYLGKTNRDLGFSEDLVRLWDGVLEAVFETGEPQSFEFGFPGRRGWTVFDCRMAPELDDRGRIQTVVSVARDVSERRSAEAALRESEARHRALFETITEGIVYQDGEGKIVSANPAAERILGLSVDQMTGRTSMDPRWRAIHQDGAEFPGDAHPAMVALETGSKVQNVVMGIFNPRREDWVWINVTAVPQFVPGEDQPYQVYSVFEEITERRRTQRALEESEERYRRLVEGSPDIAYVYSAERGALYWSPRVKEVLGISPEELKDQPYLWHDAIHPDDQPRVDEAIASREVGRFAELEYRIQDRDGAWHWFHDRFIDKREVGGETLIEGLATDITARKEAEERLRLYAEEQAALYTIAAEASAYLTPETMLASVLERVISAVAPDAGWITLPGQTLDDPPRVVAAQGVGEAFVAAEGSVPLRGCPVCSPMMAGDSSGLAWAAIRACPRLPEPVVRDLPLQTHIVVPLSAADRVLGFLHLAWRVPEVEVTVNEQLLTAVARQIGLALRNAQLYQAARQVDRLSTLNQIATSLFSSLDRDAVLRRTLELICQALGAADGVILLQDASSSELVMAMALADRTDQLRGQRYSPDEGIAGWVVQHEEPVLVNDAKRDPRFSWEVDGALSLSVHALLCAPITHLERGTGAIEILGKRGATFDDEDLALLASVASIAAVAIENARLYQETRQLAAEREETHAKLIHGAKMSALGRLTASVAHEITNPLQAVQGYLSLAEERLEGSRGQERVQGYLQIASDEVERLSDIVEQLRKFYRPTRPGFWLTDVRAVLTRVLELSRKRLEQSDVTVAWDGASKPAGVLPRVEANADQLGQVFLNMVINAIDAMPDGGTLHINSALETPPEVEHPMVRVELSDTGVGMDPVARDRIFEPFFTTKEDGSGLGLSVSYGIIQAHGGEISVSSEEGQGSTFTVRLPVEQAPDSS